MILNLNCFYSIFAKKRNSHGHFKCRKKHKIISRSCCLSAIMMLSYYFMLNSINIPLWLRLLNIRLVHISVTRWEELLQSFSDFIFSKHYGYRSRGLRAHSRFGHYFCSNLYGRAPRGPKGVKKSEFFFYK
jgi:hypothetical protein